MKEFDEETALAILFANTKTKGRKRNVDLLTLARACEYLAKLYGSQKAVGEKVGLSAEMIRQLSIASKLPTEIQSLVSDRKIDSIDILKEISAIEEPDKKIAVATTLANTSSKDVRDIKRLVKYGNLSVEDAKRIVLDAKPKGYHVFIMDFDDEMYKAIREQARDMKIDPAELVKEVVAEWLKEKKTKERKDR